MNAFVAVALSLSGLFISLVTEAQKDPSDPHWTADSPAHFEQSGKMFTVRLVPGEKQTELFILGKKKSSIRWNRFTLKADLQNEGAPSKPIEFKLEKDRFVYPGPLNQGELHLDLREHPEAPAEKLRLKLK